MSDWRQDMLLTANELARLDDAQRALWSVSINSAPSETAASASAAEGAEDA